MNNYYMQFSNCIAVKGLEVHHADQKSGSAIHETPPAHSKTVNHPNMYNQGVTKKMRTQDTQLFWQMRGQEMGNPPPPFIKTK